jgi:iron complex outermembrane receptor protein
MAVAMSRAFPGTAAVDINTIPLELIDRVDVLTGGTSAIYGADGVSGVVNFVMKRDFEGLRIRGQAGDFAT